MVSRVFVMGVGMGNPNTLTVAARDALLSSDLVVGSQRLLDDLGQAGLLPARAVALVAANQIAQALREAPGHTASVVMSGDLGFYSGSTRLYDLLEGMDVTTIPGVSSISYLCAKLHTTWQDAHVVSAHGRPCDVPGAVQSHAKTFVLAGGATLPQDLCAQLDARGMGDVRVAVGERLSYANERIVTGTARELMGGSFDSLACMLVYNDRPTVRTGAPHLPDDAFERGRVPMTKEEVRELAICKLRIRPNDVVWDVGAGTGSVSVEAARAAYAGQVFSVEKRADALELLRTNRERFGLPNLHIVAGEAPEALAGLPAPGRVFVGGTSGRLEGVLDAVLAQNPAARICIAAVTIETLSSALACVNDLGLVHVDIVQVGIAKAQEAGSYHLMRAHNPVYLITGDLGAQ